MSKSDPTVNPLVRDLLAAGGNVLLVGGYVGPTDDQYIRLYADLGLSRYIEIAKTDVVRVVEEVGKPEEPCMVYFRSSAELKYVQTASFKGDQVIAAVVSQCDGCSQEKTPQGSTARQIDTVDPRCREDLRVCRVFVGESRWRRFWCAADFFWCHFVGNGPVRL